MTMLFILATVVLTTILKTPLDLAMNALWAICLTGGVTVGGQAWVDKVTSMGGKPPKVGEAQ